MSTTKKAPKRRTQAEIVADLEAKAKAAREKLEAKARGEYDKSEAKFLKVLDKIVEQVRVANEMDHELADMAQELGIKRQSLNVAVTDENENTMLLVVAGKRRAQVIDGGTPAETETEDQD